MPADDYDAENASSLLNAYCERPAMVEPAGDVAGQQLLPPRIASGERSRFISFLYFALTA